MRERAEEAAAASAVGGNMMAAHREERRGFPRRLVAVALTGSAAAGDAEIKVIIGNDYKGRIQNIRTGTVLADIVDWQAISEDLPAGEALRCEISSAGTTNILVFHFITVP